MKIIHTDIYRFSIRMEPFVIATGTMHYAQNVLVRIHTDEGIYGVGECSAFPMIVGETQDTCLLMIKEFAGIWKGKDPLDIVNRLQELDDYSAHNSTAKSAMDMALYDLASKAADKPLYAYLNGLRRDIETDMTIGIGTAEEMVQKALEYTQNGASILKIKLGKKVKDDIHRIQSIRKSIGDDVTLRLDANQGWSFNDAQAAFEAMAPLNIEFCEQPMRTWYDDLLPELKQLSAVKIMADESCFNHHNARHLINSHSCDYINIKLAKSGGIHEALKIHEVASSAGMDCMIGSMLESRVALSANLHLAYACPGIKFFDLDTCLLGHLEDPVTGGVSYTGYNLFIDDTPGIGADADEAFLKKCEKITV
jgi:L-Ala-D/L-Glu epimerase